MNNAGADSFAGTFTGTNLSLTKSGAGTLILTGTASNYDVGTTINGGIVSFNNSKALGTGSVFLGAGTEQSSTANTTLTNFVQFATSGNSTLSAATGTTLTLGSMGTGGGNMIFGSAGNTGVVVVGPFAGLSVPTFPPPWKWPLAPCAMVRNKLRPQLFSRADASMTVDSGATLDVNDFSMTVRNLLGTGAVTLGSNAATVLTVNAGTFGGVISGSGQLDKETGGTLVLTGTNTYTGGTTIGAGTLQIGNGGGTGSIVGAITDNGILDVNRSGTLTLSAITGSGS